MKNKHDQSIENEKQTNLLGYAQYPPNEDILNNNQQPLDIDLDKIAESKEQNETKLIIDDGLNDNYLENDMDMPGVELDDEDEAIGSEDEENNYYSLGGDNHNDLEEDRGE